MVDLSKYSFDDFFAAITAKNTQLKNPAIEAYRRNFLWGHLESLQAQFPVAKIALGEKNFRFFAREYLFDCLPSSPSLDLFSSGFPDYLAHRKEIKDVPYFKHIATLDFLSTQKTGATATVPKGCLSIYSALIAGKFEGSFPAISGETETAEVQYEQGRSYLKISG